MKHISLIFTTVIFFSFLSSCMQEMPVLTIPSTPVNFKIDLMTDKIDYFDYAVFESPRRAGEYVGYAGLLIFRNQEGQIFAYDLCCPKERSKTVKVVPNSKGEAVCPVCGSVYGIWTGFGNVVSGPSTLPLQKYSVSKSSDSAYTIRN
jgi:nitrite reductase/ring-hydroxylating ferredoxin subunit